VYRQKGNRYDKAIKILLLYQKTQTGSGPNAYERFRESACQKTCWREQDGSRGLGHHEQTGYLPTRSSGSMTC
jgi:hypothetical protein